MPCPHRPQQQQGVTAMEYAVLVTWIALALLGGLSAVGLDHERIWSVWTSAVWEAMGTHGG